MDAQTLWQNISIEYPERVARITDKFEPFKGSSQELVEKLMDLKSIASIGNDKCGTVGNPYEQATEDLSVLFAAAQRISGIQGRFVWERT